MPIPRENVKSLKLTPVTNISLDFNSASKKSFNSNSIICNKNSVNSGTNGSWLLPSRPKSKALLPSIITGVLGLVSSLVERPRN